MKEIIDIFPNKNECCLLIKSAFDENFCKQLIAEKINSFKAASTHYPTSYRNNERQVVDNEILSAILFEKIEKYIPDKIEVTGISEDEHGTWKLESLNSRIRFCKYGENQYFNKHLDGVHFISKDKQSKLTFMIYLNGNEEFDGGRTLFFNSKVDNKVIGSYEPAQGDLMIFDHNFWHSGETVRSGNKYILRSDIIYKKMNKVEGDEDEEKRFCGEGHLGYIWAITQFNEKLVTSGRDRIIKVWSEDGKKVRDLNGHKNSVLSLLAFDGETIISASRDQSIRIWKKIDKKDIFLLKQDLRYHEGTVLCLCKMNDTSFVSGGADGMMNFINVDGYLESELKGHDDWIWDVVKIGSNHIASISEDGSVKTWNFKTKKHIMTWKEGLPVNSITVINEHQVLLGLLDGALVRLEFHLKVGGFKELQRKKCHDGIIRSLVVDDKYIYSGSEDNTLKIWGKEDLLFVGLHRHKNFVQDICVFKDSVISVSYDGKIKKIKKPNMLKGFL